MRKNKPLKKCFSLGIVIAMLLAEGTAALAATGWVKKNGNWYYYNAKGVKATGWVLDKGSWYYMDTKGIMKTGWILDRGSWYYLSGSGAMRTGWLMDQGKWYYLAGSGAMKTGWLSYQGDWYYLNPNGDMKTGWLSYQGDWYYLNPNGDMATGFLTLSGKTYYLNPDGDMVTGFSTVQGRKYYFNSDGSMIKNTSCIIEDIQCVFDANGVITSETPLFKADQEEKALNYIKQKKSEQPFAQQSVKETTELKQKAKELAKQYAAGNKVENTETGILSYKTEAKNPEAVIDAWLKDVGIEYYVLMSCDQIGVACYEKDGSYYWVCVTRDSKLGL